MDMEDFAKNVVRSPIANTDQQEVFQSQRFSRGDDFTMRIPVPDGIYSVTLLFAETYQQACVPGGRVFDISLGTPVSGVTKVVDNFDVFQAAGCSSAFGQKFDRVPAKEGIVVHLTQKAQHPTLCGFIVEGFPVPKPDGSEYKAIARAPAGAQGGDVAAEGMSGEASQNVMG
ncbi:Malectin [Gracilaria domingensis]|nr:Malectin [Gracilaria domingensis]